MVQAQPLAPKERRAHESPGAALAPYALERLPCKVMAANYRMVLPDA